jgi:CO/xanthine dehydrogenase Mo-binding subunit
MFQFVFLIGIPMGLAVAFFPGRTHPEPGLSRAILFIMSHMLLVVGALYMSVVEKMQLKLKNVFYLLGIGNIGIIVIYFINKALSTNFLYIMYAQEGTVIEQLNNIFGWPGYVLIMAHPFGTGSWRAPGNNTNTFARESQINIMAAKAGIDPLEFRLKNLKDERMIGVLKAVADLFGYTPGKTPSGRGIGIACGTDVDSYVAHMAEVKVDQKTGKVQVVRVACAQDMGLCINPEGAAIQMEGCITMGLGYCLTEEIQFQGGKIANKNFDSYEIPRFSWVPKISTTILDKRDQPAHGGGEPAIICMGGLIANAVFDACGARLYQLPMTPERVLEAIRKR